LIAEARFRGRRWLAKAGRLGCRSKSHLDLRDQAELEAFEAEITSQRATSRFARYVGTCRDWSSVIAS
jgi:hypothetical protein